jgi:hypothetical protein
MPLLLLVLAALLLAAPVAASPVEVRHQPLSCVPRDAHAVVTASAARIDDVATAELQFRRGAKGDWYAVPMILEGDAWSARLPRPQPRLKQFQYRVVMTSTNLEPTALPPTTVRVMSSGCTTPAEKTAASSIVVRVPRGSSPVPSGFEPVGLVPTEDQSSHREVAVKTAGWAKILAAGAVAAGAAAIALNEKEAPGTPPFDQGFGTVDNPGFTFSHTVPPSGTTLSLGATSLLVFVNMQREPVSPLDLDWRVELSRPLDTSTCVTMSGAFDNARSPLGLVLTGPLVSTGACGNSFEVARARLFIGVRGARFIRGQPSVLHDEFIPLSFHVEP